MWKQDDYLHSVEVCSFSDCLFVFGATTPSGPGTPHSRGL